MVALAGALAACDVGARRVEPPESTDLAALDRRVAALETALAAERARPVDHASSPSRADPELARELGEVQATLAELRRRARELQEALALLDSGRRAAPAAVAPASQPASVLDVTFRVTETNRTWWRLAWLCRVRNDTDAAVRVRVKVLLRDDAGFTVDEDTSDSITLAARDVQEVAGFELVDAAVAGNVTQVSASVERG